MTLDLGKRMYEVLKLTAAVRNSAYASSDEEVQKKLKQISDIYRKYIDRGKNKHKPFAPINVLDVLYKCTVNHRFDSAAAMLQLYCHRDMKPFGYILFKTGFQVIQNHPRGDLERMQYYMRYVEQLPSLVWKEKVLEYVIYLLKQNELQKAKDYIAASGSYKFGPKKQVLDLLVKGYMGILHYLEWKEKLTSCEDDDQMIEPDVRNDSHAMNAIVALKEAVDEECVWDIFILKLVEILEFYGNIQEAMEVLDNYTDAKEDHLYAYIYFYEFLKKHNLSHAYKLHCLKNIARLSPSDAHVLDYVLDVRESVLKVEEKYSTSLQLLFNFVDYSCNKDNLEAWQLLAKVLSEAKQLEYHQLIRDVWKIRKSYWPAYHFNSSTVSASDKTGAKLLIAKATVCQHLHFDCTSYIEAASTAIHLARLNHSKKYIRRIEAIESAHKRP